MTSEDAIRWVDKNRGSILFRVEEYAKHTPYDVEDYLQDAYSASIEAALCCQKNLKLKFIGVFWTVFRRNIAKVTPLPDDAREELKKKKEERARSAAGNPVQENTCTDTTDDDGSIESQKKKTTYYSGGTSMSFPNSAIKDIPLEGVVHKKRSNRRIDIEKVYENLVKPVLSDREQQVMELALGVTMEGSLNFEEIAERLGVSRRSVRTFEDRALKKAQERGKVIMLQNVNKGLKPLVSCVGKESACKSVSSDGRDVTLDFREAISY